MTGRDLIMYILANGLEDKKVFENGNFIGFMTDVEAAAKFNVGVSTIRAWVGLEWIEAIEIGGQLYIPIDAEKPAFVYVFSERG